MNKVNLIGNLTKDVEFGGVNEIPFCRANLAVKNGKDTEFIPFVAFGKTAEILRDYTAKGSKVALCGHLKYETWEVEGKKNYALKFIANEVELLSSKAEEKKQELTEIDDDSLPF